MPPLLAQSILAPLNGKPEDAVVNTFAFNAAAAFTTTMGNTIRDAIANLWNYTGSNVGVGLRNYMADSVSRAANAHQVKIYDLTGALDGSPHGSPIYTGTWTMGGTAPASALPAECAIAVTLRGQLWASEPVEAPDGPDAGTAPDRPRQRRSGRVYIGPLTASHGSVDASGYLRPSTTGILEVILDTFQQMQSTLVANNVPLAVWSRADAAVVNVSDVQVDDAYDTQRRRGPASTVRLTRTVL